jgi:hypothetical protein
MIEAGAGKISLNIFSKSLFFCEDRPIPTPPRRGHSLNLSESGRRRNRLSEFAAYVPAALFLRRQNRTFNYR